MAKNGNTMTSETKFDLEERTSSFSKEIIHLSRKAPKDIVTIPIISQLVRSATSVGANYCEANNAESRKDFLHKIGICKKEAKETKYWLELLGESSTETRAEAKRLWQEAKELNLIFSAISSRTANK